jgi:hypothetical protein
MLHECRVPTACLCVFPGNSSEFCGSPVAMDVSTTSGYAAAVSTGAESGFQGCFSDSATMQAFYFTSTLISPNLCAEACSLKGYTLSGVSQGSKQDFFYLASFNYQQSALLLDKCICGNTIPKNLVPVSTCNVACAGKPLRAMSLDEWCRSSSKISFQALRTRLAALPVQ